MRTKLALIVMVVVLIGATAACDTSKLGVPVTSNNYRTYNNAQYGSLAVHDGIAPGMECAVGLTLTGVGIVGAIAAFPEDTLLLSLSWGSTAWGAGVTLSACWDTWKQTVQEDAFSRMLLSCSNPEGVLSPLVVSLGYCDTMGWATTAVEATLNIALNVMRGITGCNMLVYDPLHGHYWCAD